MVGLFAVYIMHICNVLSENDYILAQSALSRILYMPKNNDLGKKTEKIEEQSKQPVAGIMTYRAIDE